MVSRVWRAFGLQPHRAKTFKLSTDPAFVDKVHDVAGLYLAPPHRAIVLCVDEKPQIQATPSQPTTSSPASNASANELTTQTTRLPSTGQTAFSLTLSHRRERNDVRCLSALSFD